MQGFIDIEYGVLKDAISQLEAKRGVCRVMPSARFRWQAGRMVGDDFQTGNHMPNLDAPREINGGVSLDCLVCDGLGGESTGVGVTNCYNCQPDKRPKEKGLYPENTAEVAWQYKDATCSIVPHSSLGHYCGYVRFKKNPFTRGCHYEGFRNYIPVHGGITYAKKDKAGYIYGFDCAHAGDEDRAELKDMNWLRQHCEAFYEMLIMARPYEVKYNRLSSTKAKARLIDEYRGKVGANEELGFGALINVLAGTL